MAPQPGHDIFVSYAREDEPRVQPLVSALEAQGWRVFWDRTIPVGETWLDYIGTRLEAAPVVIVAWSRHSVQSEFVYSEASRARARRALLPILIDRVSPPLGLDSVHAADLVPWFKAGGTGPLPRVLIEAIGQRVGDRQSLPDAPAPPPAETAQRPAGSKARSLVIAGVAVAAVVAAGAVFVPTFMTTTPKPSTASVPPTTDGRPAPVKAPGATTHLPFPTVDFVLESRLLGSSAGMAPGSRTVLRHKDGMLRIDLEMHGAQAYVLAARNVDTATMVMIQPTGMTMAMEVDLTKPLPDNSGFVGLWWRTIGTPVGADRIMGEPCQWWQTQAADPVRTCFTADGIPLKVEKISSGETHWQAVKLERTKQDAAQFTVPANATRLQMPVPQRQ